MPVVVFPVLVRESAELQSTEILHSHKELICFVEEFADLIDEFEGWDSLCRPLNLRSVAQQLQQKSPPIATLANDTPEVDSVWRIVNEYCALNEIMIDKLPISPVSALDGALRRKWNK